MEEELLRRLRETIGEFRLINPREKVVVAVSGGPDSVVLLHALRRLAEEIGCSLHVAHFDHGLRPESGEDAAYVRALAGSLGVPCTVGEGRVRERAARERLSLQAAAREERYAFLRGVARQSGAQKIALGHQRDDQAETFLLRLLRGAGLDGLAAIRPARPDGIIRPLLYVGREEIEAYCCREGLSPRLDPTNLKPVYIRNRLRLHLIPVLADYNPRVREVLARTAEELRADAELLEELTAAAWSRLCRQSGDDVVTLFGPGCRGEPVALQRRLLRQALAILGGRVEYGLVERLRGLLREEQAIQLPGMLAAWTEGENLRLGKRNPSRREVRLETPGRTLFSAVGVALEAGLLPGGSDGLAAARRNFRPDLVYLDADKTGSASVRLPRAGDRFRPLGLGGTQKLGNFFTHRKLVRWSRPFVPLVVAGGRIAWVAGYAPAEEFKVDAGTERILRLELTVAPSAGRFGEVWGSGEKG